MKDAFKNITMIIISPLFLLLIIVMIGYSKLLKLDKKVGEEKIVFAIIPKFTNKGMIWLKKVKRKVEYNRDFISWAQYMYYDIKND